MRRLRCLLGLHRWEFFKARRLDEENILRAYLRSVVYQYRCLGCGRMYRG